MTVDIREIEETFTKTGKTGANGISYVSPDKDMCATIYGHGDGKRGRVFYNRKKGYEDREKRPCFYEDEIHLGVK
ncbi:MAG: hypothetical protein ABUJ92_00215 [Desulfobacterales bacterium]